MSCIHTLLAFALTATAAFGADRLEFIRVSDDGTHFVGSDSGERFVVWGVNYDHDHGGRLLDEYWDDDWETVVADFQEMRALGANCVRVHLQFGKFMQTADVPNAAALTRLRQLLRLAEETGLYLDVTGLACYHRANVPAWYDALDEAGRWEAQANFWEAVAKTCRNSPAVFCYDLMNEPILPGNKPATDWLAGEFGGKFFVQRLTLDLRGRTREQVAAAWVDHMVTAIRRHDERHLVTVGVIPWVFVFGGGKPLFYGPEVGQRLDFAAVHFYPQAGEVAKAVTALAAYDVGKPLVIEEMFPLKCSREDLLDFIRQTADRADGWISFYWGRTPAELRRGPAPSIGDAITADWLELFQQQAETFRRP